MAEYIVGIADDSTQDIDSLHREYAVNGMIVRRNDCKHWDADEHDCNIKIGWFACGADWFCADGERQEGGEANETV